MRGPQEHRILRRGGKAMSGNLDYAGSQPSSRMYSSAIFRSRSTLNSITGVLFRSGGHIAPKKCFFVMWIFWGPAIVAGGFGNITYYRKSAGTELELVVLPLAGGADFNIALHLLSC